MRALVTGCAGFIGSHLTESLLEDGSSVLGIDCFNDNYGRRSKLENLHHAQAWDSFEFVPVDLARGDLRELVADTDVVFHLAAEPGVRPSWGDRFETYVRNNVIATQQLLEAALEAPSRRLVYASSSSVYGQAERLPTPETQTPAPFSPYGLTKLSAEHLCHMYGQNFGVDTVTLRYFSVYGPRQRPDMAFHRFCEAAREGRPIQVYGDGRQTRDFTFVGDIVAATRAAGATPAARGQIINVGGGTRASLADALDIVAELCGRPLDVHHSEAQEGDVRDTGASIELARELLGYEPEVRLPDGLERQWAWAAERAVRAPL